MIRLHFSSADLTRITFASSPLWETVTSIRTLTAGDSRHHLHAPWRRSVGRRLDGVDMRLLTALVRPAGYIPDFLVPSPPRRTTTFETALEQLAASDAAEVAAQLGHLADHKVAQAGAGREDRVALLKALAEAPEAALKDVTRELAAYWHAAVAPCWLRIQSLLQADLAHRLEQLAGGGVEELLRTLHPSVRFERDTMQVVKYYDGDVDLSGRGLLLVPCAFAWPEVIVLTAQPHVPTVSYSPRGLGRLWEKQASTGQSAIADVLGRTRAALLAQLDLPMSTTQLATQLALSAPTLSVHLQALRAAGILTSRRDGREVLYARTPLGDLLLAQAQGPR